MSDPARTLREGIVDGRMVRIEGDDGSVSGHHQLHAAAFRLHREPSWWRSDHEAQARGAALDRHRPQCPLHRHLRVRPRGGAGPRLLPPVAAFPFEGDELVYSDPPYVQSTRKSRRRCRFDYTDADHGALLGILKALPCQVMVSGYPSALYDRMLVGWHSVSVQGMNQAGVVTEKLWCNFAPGKPHWHTMAGRNFTDRQRIKRHAASWARRYRAMPPGERLAVLAAVMAVEAEG